MGKKKLLIIIAAVVVLVAAGAVYFFVFRNAEPKIVYTNYLPGESFVTNVKGGNRLFKTVVVLVLDTDDAKLQEQLDKNQPKIRDRIIFILRELDEETIRDTQTQEKLRRDIRDAINGMFEFEHVADVWFNDYVMQ